MLVGRVLGRVCAAALLASVAGMALAPSSARAEITYSQILAAPDDAKLNIAYARQEVANGRLQQAAAALERLLLARPNWDAVRLFYGFVLYRLDDLNGAKREFELLEGRGLSPKQESNRLKYLALATQKGKSVRVSGRISIGGRYDTNPGRVSDAVGASSISSKEDDFGLFASSRFRVESDLKNGRGDFLFFQSNGLIRDFFDVNRADLAAPTARAGIKLHADKMSITPYGIYSATWLQYERLQQSAGAGVDLGLTLSSQVSLHLKGQALYQDYESTSFSAIGSRRDGWRYKTSARVRWRPSDALMLSAGVTYRTKDAKDDGFSYESGSFSMAAQQLLGMGRYVSLAATVSRVEYDQPDNFYSTTTTRKDDKLRLRAATGAPLSTIFADFGLPQQLGDLVAQLGATYSYQESTIDQLDIDNFSVDVTLTKRFSF